MIAQLLASRGTLILDGSMGQELLHRGVPDDPVLWSATALQDNAAAVEALHAAYLAAGADILTTNTYATNLNRFRADRSLARFERLNRLAGEIARDAITVSERDDALLAASVPPMRGSYRADQVLSFDRMLEEYAPQVEILADYVDIFLCETMSSAEEGRAAATAALAVAGERPVWVSWTLQDGGSDRLRSGESLAEAIAALASLGVSGYLVNCCSPESASLALPQLADRDVTVKGAYANGFVAIPDTWLKGDGADVLGKRTDLDPAAYARYAEEWIAAGANLVGGCCEIGPAHIAEIAALRTALA